MAQTPTRRGTQAAATGSRTPDALGYPTHPVDRSSSKRLPPVSPSKRGFALLQTQLQMPGRPLPVAALKDLLKTPDDTDAPFDPERDAHRIRDTFMSLETECSGVGPIVAGVCDAYDKLLRRVQLAAATLPAPTVNADAAGTVMVEYDDGARSSDGGVLSVASGDAPLPATVDDSSFALRSSFSAALPRSNTSGLESLLLGRRSPMRSDSSSRALRDAQCRIEELERENAALQQSGAELRAAAQTTTNKLTAALAGLTRAHVLEGVALEDLKEVTDMNASLADPSARLTLLLLATQWQKREAALVSEIENLQRQLGIALMRPLGPAAPA